MKYRIARIAGEEKENPDALEVQSNVELLNHYYNDVGGLFKIRVVGNAHQDAERYPLVLNIYKEMGLPWQN